MYVHARSEGSKAEKDEEDRNTSEGSDGRKAEESTGKGEETNGIANSANKRRKAHKTAKEEGKKRLRPGQEIEPQRLEDSSVCFRNQEGMQGEKGGRSLRI